MAILKIVTYGDDVLRQKAEKVAKVSAKVQKLVADMFDTMYANNGCGLAAPQVGELKRIFVLDCSTDEEPMPRMVFINPVIIAKKGAIVSKEGCLSFPDVYTEVKRYETVTVRYMDLKGRTQVMTTPPGSLLSRAVQHELDHLDGILYIDHVIDRFEAENALKAKNLPPIQPEFLLQEPELAEALQLAS